MELKGFKWSVKNLETYYKWLWVGITLFIFYKMGTYFMPFVKPMFLAALLAIFMGPSVYKPLTNKLRRTFRKRKSLAENLAALIVAVSFTVCIVAPVCVSSFYIADQAVEYANVTMDSDWRSEKQELGIEKIEAFTQKHPWSKFALDKVVNVLKTDEAQWLASLGLGRFVKGIGGYVVSFAKSVAETTLLFLWNLLVMLVALGLFLKHGKNIATILLKALPFDREETEEFQSGLSKGVTALFKSMIATGFGQGGLGFLGFSIYAMNYTDMSFFAITFIGFVMVFSSAITVPTSTLILLIVAMSSIFQGHIVAAIILAVWAFFPVSASDNFIRSKIVGDAIKVHPAIIILVMLGGVIVDGPIGIFSGPFMLFLTILVAKTFKSIILKREIETT